MEVIKKEEVEIKFLQVSAGVRYWENGTVDGVEDTEGELMPCIEGENWSPLIELETGKIVNWKQGTKASTYYKVCDCCVISFLDEEKVSHKIIEGYVPDILSPKEEGYGDYVIMDIDENGMIQNWKPSLDWLEDYQDFS